MPMQGWIFYINIFFLGGGEGEGEFMYQILGMVILQGSYMYGHEKSWNFECNFQA